MYHCQACFNYQEELLDLDNGCGQVPCFCFSPEELMAQHLARQWLIDMPNDSELENAMLEEVINTQPTDEDIDFVVERAFIDYSEYVDGDIIDTSDDEEEDMMEVETIASTQSADDDKDIDFVAEPVIIPEGSVVVEEEENDLSMDGEILEDYNSQLYEFAVAVRYDRINQLHREIFERYCDSQLCKHTDKSE